MFFNYCWWYQNCTEDQAINLKNYCKNDSRRQGGTNIPESIIICNIPTFGQSATKTIQKLQRQVARFARFCSLSVLSLTFFMLLLGADQDAFFSSTLSTLRSQQLRSFCCYCGSILRCRLKLWRWGRESLVRIVAVSSACSSSLLWIASCCFAFTAISKSVCGHPRLRRRQ